MNVTILEVPSDTDFATLPQDVQEAIRSVGGDFIHDRMPGTRIYQLKKAINSVVNTDLATIEAMITFYGLDWIVLAMQTAMKVLQYDAEGEPIIDPDTGLQVNAVDVYRLLPLTFIDYCADVYDGEGNPTRPIVIPPLAKFSGHEDWVLPS
jgi:hypothetical protein